VIVSLLDVSRQDVAAEVLASETIKTDGRQVPIPFTLIYEPNRIQPNHTYRVQARILIGNELRFISTRSYPVITQGRPNTVEVLVEPVK
jgi:putative lipoprotein